MSLQDAEDFLGDPDGWIGRQDEETRADIQAGIAIVPEEQRPKFKQGMAARYVVAEAMGMDIGDVEDHWELSRRAFADHMGEDWKDSAADDDKFISKLGDWRQRRQEERVLFTGKDGDDEGAKQSRADSMQTRMFRAAVAGDNPTRAFVEWEQKAMTQPGFSPDRLEDYFERSREIHGEASTRLAPLLPLVNDAFAAITGGMTDLEATSEELAGRVGALTPKQRGDFLAALRVKAEASGEKEQATFWQNLSTSASRAYDSQGRQSRGFWSAVGQALKLEASFYVPGMEPEQQVEGIAKNLFAYNLESDLRRVQEGNFAPIKQVLGDYLPGWLERGVYGAPGAAMSTLTAVVPLFGAPATFGIIAGQAYEQERFRLIDAGMSEEDASVRAGALAPIVAAPQAVLEKLGAEAVLGRLPFLKSALVRLGDRAGGGAAAYGVRALGGGLSELGTETAQNLVQPLMETVAAALDKDLPEVTWRNGRNGVLDGFWAQTGETFVALLPLALIGAVDGGQHRVRALSGATDLQLQAFGARAEDVQAFRTAVKEGEFSANDAAETLLENLDPQGEAAKAATAQLSTVERKAAATGAAQTEQQFKEAGVQRLSREKTGWTMHLDSGEKVSVGSVQAAQVMASDLLLTKSADEAAVLVGKIDEWVNAAPEDVQRVVNATPDLVETDGKQERRFRFDQEVPAEFSQKEIASLGQEAAETLNQAGDSDVWLGVNGANWVQKVKDGTEQMLQRIDLFQSDSAVLTFFHEQVEADVTLLEQKGTITQAHKVQALGSLAKFFDPATAKDAQVRELFERVQQGARGELTPVQLRETISELAVADIFGRSTKGGKLQPGSISAALDSDIRAIASQDPEAARGLGKVRSFFRAVRQYFRGLFASVNAIRRAERAGGGGDWRQLMNKVFGVDEQAEHDEAVAAETDGWHEEFGQVAFSLKKRTDKPKSWEEVRPGHSWNAAKQHLPRTNEPRPKYFGRGSWEKLVQQVAESIRSQGTVKDPWGASVQLDADEAKGTFGDPLLNRAAHLIGEDPQKINVRSLDTNKLAWFGAIGRTVRDAQVRVVQEAGKFAGGTLYFRSYNEGVHMVVVADGAVADHYSIVTQYAPKRSESFEGAWVEQVRPVPGLAALSSPDAVRIPAQPQDQTAQIPTPGAQEDTTTGTIGEQAAFSLRRRKEKKPRVEAEQLELLLGSAKEALDGGTDNIQGQAADGEGAAAPSSLGEILGRLSEASAEELQEALAKSKGRLSSIVPEKAGREIPAWNINGAKIEGPADVAALMQSIRSPYFESLKVLVLDDEDRVVHSQILTVGTLAESIASPRDLLLTMSLLRKDQQGKKIILSHNHPSGVVQPSEADRKVQARMERVATSLGYEVVDHVITNGETYHSLRADAAGELPKPELAHWEVVKRSSLASLLTNNEYIPSKAAPIINLLRSTNDQAMHLIFLNTKAAVSAIYRFDAGLSLGEIKQEALRGAAHEGAWGVIFDAGQMDRDNFTYSLSELGSVLQLAHVRLLDASSKDFPSAAEAYLIREGEPGFRLSAADRLDASRKRLAAVLESNPERRLAIYQRANQKLVEMQGRFTNGGVTPLGDEIRPVTEKRTAKELSKEQAVREALRASELLGEAMSQMSAESLQALEQGVSKLEDHPLVATMLGNHGKLMSRTQAAKRGRYGEFDGVPWLPPQWYAGGRGGLMPDEMAQYLYDEGLLKDASPDSLWDALRAVLVTHQQESAKFSSALEYARSAEKSARATAKAEAAAWRAEQDAMQRKDWSALSALGRDLRTLDAILSVLPMELRAKVGGHTKIASFASAEARQKEIERRIEKLGEVLEKQLRKDYDAELEKLFKRAKPKREAGKKAKGKAGADIHALFATLEEAKDWTPEKADVHATGLEAQAFSGEVTPEQVAHMLQEAALVRLVADWDNADAARRAAAVENAKRVFESGYAAFKIQKQQEAERRQAVRRQLRQDAGKEGTRQERGEQRKKEAKSATLPRRIALGLLNFEQVLHTAFGHNSADAGRLANLERNASYQKTDEVQDFEERVHDLYTKLAGGNRLKGEELAWKLSQPSLKAGGIELSEMEAITATLMWRQDDGRRHMEGQRDENNRPVSAWHYDQAFIDEIEAKLSAEGRAVRAFIATEYASEYPALNAVYRQLNGIDLPKNANYSPLTVKPMQAKEGQTIDPVTGSTFSSGSPTPGALRTRGVAIAEPDFRDAMQTLIAHTKQMAHWKAYAPVVTEMQAVLGNRDVTNSVEAAMGEQAVSVLNSWVGYFAQGGTRDAAAHLELNRTLGDMTTRAATMALVGRAGTLMLQSTQLAAALAEVPTGAYLKRFGKLMSGQLDWSGALASPYIQRRMQEMPAVVRAALDGLRAQKPNLLRHGVQRLGSLLGGTDALFTAGTYAIVRDYHLAQAKEMGATGQDAENYATRMAERVTDRVAQPTRPGARSLFENTATSPLSRIIWAFASESRKNLGLAVYALMRQPPAAKARTLVALAVSAGIASVIRTAWRDRRDDGDDEIFDEKHWGLKRLFLAAATEPLQGVPVLGDVAQGAVYKAAGEYHPGDNLFGGVERAVPAVRRLPETLNGEAEVSDALRDAEAIMTAMGYFSSDIAAATSLMHIVRDTADVVQNADGE